MMRAGPDPRPRDLDALLGTLAEEAAPEVLQEAVTEARRRARDQLADRLSEALVDAVARLLTARSPVAAGNGASPPATAPPADPAPAAGPADEPDEPAQPDRGLYAYAMTRSEPLALGEVVGVEGAGGVDVVTHRGLALVVSEVPLTLLSDVSETDLSESGDLARLARRHDDVVRAVFEAAPVLPLRFGTVVPDRAAAVRLLEQEHERALAQLDRLAGHREWGVRLRRPQAPAASEPSPPPPRERPTGTAYLDQRRRELEDATAQRQHLATAADAVQRALARWSDDAVTRSPGPEHLLDAAYLLPRAAEPAFLAEVERLTSDLGATGLGLDVTGPWPPYSFATAVAEAVPGG